jgi:hypothetical protein
MGQFSPFCLFFIIIPRQGIMISRLAFLALVKVVCYEQLFNLASVGRELQEKLT